MSKPIFITGVAGTGKSAFLDELAKRGYKTIDIDHIKDAKSFYRSSDNSPITHEQLQDIDDWTKHVYGEWNIKYLKSFLSDNQVEFFGGYNPGQSDIYGLAQRTFMLTANPDLLDDRLKQRTEGVGTTVEQRSRTREQKDSREKDILNAGAIPFSTIGETEINVTRFLKELEG